MHYEDQARRFNLLSGLLFGALLGSVLALLAGPLRGLSWPRRRRSRRQRALKRGLAIIRAGSRRFSR